MKKRIYRVALVSCLALLLLFIGYKFAPVTPEGGTRLAILCSGHPIKAIITKLERVKIYDDQLSFILSDPPYEKETDGILDQWNVTKYGIFYWAEYGVG